MRESTKRALEAAKTRIAAAGMTLSEAGLVYHSTGLWVGFCEKDGETLSLAVYVEDEKATVHVYQRVNTWSTVEKPPAPEPEGKKPKKKVKTNAS